MLIDCFRNIIKISSLHGAYRPFSHLRIKFDEFIIHINLPLPLQGEADRNVGVSRSENIQQYHNNGTNITELQQLTCRVSGLIYKLLTVESQSPSE